MYMLQGRILCKTCDDFIREVLWIKDDADAWGSGNLEILDRHLCWRSDHFSYTGMKISGLSSHLRPVNEKTEISKPIAYFC